MRDASARGFARWLRRSSDGAARSERKRGEVAKGFGFLSCRLPTRNLGGGADARCGEFGLSTRPGRKARRVKRAASEEKDFMSTAEWGQIDWLRARDSSHINVSFFFIHAITTSETCHDYSPI